LPPYLTIGDEERRRVLEVLDSGTLSGFLGTWSEEFRGGSAVRQLEAEWADYFGIAHAVAVNSATSGLHAAVGAAGIGPGDEVIVSPYTMSASASAPLIWGGVPVFADIDPETFCISADTIRDLITARTRAIIVVDLFGWPADMDPIMDLAAEHDLVVIEDAAQAPGARYRGRFAGTLAHIGVLSLNRHKTIQTGEGGIAVTDDPRLADRLQLIRNHAEAVVGDKGNEDLTNLVGFNFRLCEIEAAIASEQLKKLDGLLAARLEIADRLTATLSELPGLSPPRPGEEIVHGYYEYAVRYDASAFGVERNRFTAALRAEGVPAVDGYVKPLYLEPMFQRRIAIGSDGFPFTLAGPHVSYSRGICPVTERMYDHELFYANVCYRGISEQDVDDVVRGFEKVVEHSDELRD
jgi:perosamine synthetase